MGRNVVVETVALSCTPQRFTSSTAAYAAPAPAPSPSYHLTNEPCFLVWDDGARERIVWTRLVGFKSQTKWAEEGGRSRRMSETEREDRRGYATRRKASIGAWRREQDLDKPIPIFRTYGTQTFPTLRSTPIYAANRNAGSSNKRAFTYLNAGVLEEEEAGEREQWKWRRPRASPGTASQKQQRARSKDNDDSSDIQCGLVLLLFWRRLRRNEVSVLRQLSKFK
ncbi:hypothetical protein C8R46DRAFT_180097 [Mycena filopes]|nr:hypothetical protein C8R46DRAFT_180097 [Mycena filopes]